MKPVDFLPGARLDFDVSFDWYAVRSTVAAERFSVAVETALSRVAGNPDQFAEIDARHRECIVRRFPFRIVFRVEASRIVVVAIAHAKRRPGYWKGRG
jgi:plasmid stabilization system protein ParE